LAFKGLELVSDVVTDFGLGLVLAVGVDRLGRLLANAVDGAVVIQAKLKLRAVVVVYPCLVRDHIEGLALLLCLLVKFLLLIVLNGYLH